MAKNNKVTIYPRQSTLAGKLKELDITYEELAKATGYSHPSSIAMIINGDVDFRMSTARKFCMYMSKKARRQIELHEIII